MRSRFGAGFVAFLACAFALCACSGSEESAADGGVRLVGAESDGPLQVDFGAVSTAAAQAVRTIVLANDGAEPVRIEPPALQPPFQIEPREPFVLDGGERRELALSFAPATPGSWNVEARLRHAGGELPVWLLAKAVAPQLACTPARVDFGRVEPGRQVRAEVLCTNETGQAVPIAGALDGEHADRFQFNLAADLELPGKAAVRIPLTFSAGAAEPGPRSARLVLRAGATVLQTIELQARAIESALEVAPSCASGGLDFGYVTPGGEAERMLVLRNVGSEPVRVDALRPDGASPFEVRTAAPFVLPPDDPATPEREGEAEVRIAFTPTTTGQKTGRIAISRDDGQRELEVCVTGHGGGPRLTCTPQAIDFGVAAVGLPVDRSFTCTNTGEDVAGTSLDNLFVDAVTPGDGPFDVRVIGGPRPQGYASGESFEVRVTFAPQAAGVVSTDVLVLTNDATARATPVHVSGEGLELLPCAFAITPQAIDFGLVPPGESAALEFAVRNLSDHACLIRDLRLAGQAGSPFSLEAAADHVLGGNEAARFTLRFDPSPGGAGTVHTEEVRFTISDPARRHQAIPLRAVSGPTCLAAAPGSLDLGTAAISCATEPKEILLYNVCTSPIDLSSIEIVPSAACADPLGNDCPFEVEALDFPAPVPPGGWVAVAVRYAAAGPADDRGGLHVQVAGSADPVLVPLRGGASAGALRRDSFVAGQERPKVDVLWVLDDSCHSRQHQALADNFFHFLAAAEAARADFHLGITTTNTSYGPKGRLVPVDGSRPRILHGNTPDLAGVWAANVQVGTAGSATEQGLLAARMALGPGLIDVADVVDTPEPNDGNLGFLRSDAALAIVFVAGEPDHDNTPADDHLDFFRRLKGIDRREQLKIHALAPEFPSGCVGDGGEGGDYMRYFDVVQATGGVFRSFCTPDWGPVLAEIGSRTFDGPSSFPLTNRPQCGGSCDDSIVVRLAGAPAPAVVSGVRRWGYDAVSNAIVFPRAYRPSPGTEVTAEYAVTCN